MKRTFAYLALFTLATIACSPGGGSAADPVDMGGGPAPGSTPTAPSGTGGQQTIFNPNAATPAASCASAAYESKLLPSNLLFLVDRSGSMNCNLPPITDSATCERTATTADPSQPTKWSVVTSSMSAALDRLATVPSTSVGLTLFSADDVCGAESAPNVALSPLAVPQVAALKGAMTGVTPSGATPIVGATILGFRHLHQEAQAPGNRYVVLVTDGADSCLQKYAEEGVTGDVVAQLLNVELPKALSVNIRTFVIGAPGSEPARGLLSKIAFAGGSARDPGCDRGDNPAPGAECHLDMTRTTDFAKDLSDALANITGRSAMTCEFDVPTSDGKEVDTGSVNVDYYQGGDTTDPTSKVELYRDDTKPCDAGADGWQYIENNTKIRFCGALCDRVHADTNARVIVSLGCAQRVR
jgi:hypothetical protein